MTRYIAIDMGSKGALASISDTGVIHQVSKMPVHPDGEVDGYEVMVWIAEEIAGALEAGEEFQIWTEDLHSIFGVSAKSNFQFGKNIGRVLGATDCLEVQVNEVHPKTWQALIFAACEVPEMGEVKKGRYKRDTKGMAAWAATLLWPDEDLNHDGKVDALLIAEFARRSSMGPKEIQ
jgi:hypothetical protein